MKTLVTLSFGGKIFSILSNGFQQSASGAITILNPDFIASSVEDVKAVYPDTYFFGEDEDRKDSFVIIKNYFGNIGVQAYQV